MPSTGGVLSWDLPQVGVNRLAQCVRDVFAAFPRAESIYIVWDNWLVHERNLPSLVKLTLAKRRHIDLDGGTVEVLRTHRGQQLLQKLEAEGAYQDCDLVFADALGLP